MSNSLTLADAAALYADPAGAVGFPSENQDGYAVPDQTPPPRWGSGKHKKRRRDDGKSRLEMSDAIALFAGTEREPSSPLSVAEGIHLLAYGKRPRSDGALSVAEGVALIAGMAKPAEASHLALNEGVAELVDSERAEKRTARRPANAPVTDYTVTSTNAAIQIARTQADLQAIERELRNFVSAYAQAFPDVIADKDAFFRLDIPRFAKWVEAQNRIDQFSNAIQQAQAAHQQAWEAAFTVEDRAFLEANPDLDQGDFDQIGAMLSSVMPPSEILSLWTSPQPIDIRDPRVVEVVAAAAGSTDPEAVRETLLSCGFTDEDMAAIAAGRASPVHLRDHRAQALLLKASQALAEAA